MSLFVPLLDLPAITDGDLAGGFAGAGTGGFHCLDNIVAFDNLPKNHMLAVQVRRWGGADEELRAVGVRAGNRQKKKRGRNWTQLFLRPAMDLLRCEWQEKST